MSGDLELYRKRVRAALAPLAPDAPGWERDGHLPRALFRELGAAGAFTDRWEHGPAGGLPHSAVLIDELTRVNGGAALAVSIHSELYVHALLRFGGERHAGAARAAARGETIGAVAITEPAGGSDVPAITTSARRDGDGWHLTGTKRYITNLGCATHVLVLARTAERDRFSLFSVPIDHPGVRVTGFFATMGVRSADTGAVEFDARLTDEHVVGRTGAGLLHVLTLLDFERVAAAVGLVAAARHALRLAAGWMRRRTQFGSRLFDHQSLRHRLAQQWAEVEAAAALVDAATRDVRGDRLPHQTVAAAKLVAARVCSTAVDEALQMLGARGYTEAWPFERFVRDARLTRIGGGTDEVLREIVAGGLDVEDAATAEELDHLSDHDHPRESR